MPQSVQHTLRNLIVMHTLGEAERQESLNVYYWTGIDLANFKQTSELSAAQMGILNCAIRVERRQINLEAIVDKGEEIFASLPGPTDNKPVVEDWMVQFLNYAQDVSDEQMQLIWAKLLAGEISKPGSFSARTMAAVKLFSKEEADLFTRFCTMVWHSQDHRFPVYYGLGNIKAVPGPSLVYSDFMYLDSIGLIRFQPQSTLRFPLDSDTIVLAYFDKQVAIKIRDDRQLMIGVTALTEVGQQLSAIPGAKPDYQYLAWIKGLMESTGYKVDIVNEPNWSPPPST